MNAFVDQPVGCVILAGSRRPGVEIGAFTLIIACRPSLNPISGQNSDDQKACFQRY